MDLVEQIGAYAGFAAVVGLAVLSALYFSQARDLKRLREWAGRAPDRTGPVARPAQAARRAPGQVPAARQAPTPGQAPKPGQAPAQPLPASPPAGQQGAAVKRVPGPAAPNSSPGMPAPATRAATPAGSAPSPAGPPPPRRAAPLPNASGRPGLAAPPRAAPARSPSNTAIIGAPARGRWYQRIAPRYAVLAVAGVLIVGGGAAFGVSQLLSGDDEGAPAKPAGAQAGEPRAGGGRADPSAVTVAVLNGTTVPGLAAQVADKLEDAKYRRGNVANATEQQRAESVVFYADGAAADARAVARRLDISQTERIDSRSQSLAGNASVVVVVGADQTQ